jgi:hypothetical protein
LVARHPAFVNYLPRICTQPNTAAKLVPGTADQIGANCLGDEESGFVRGQKLSRCILQRPANLAMTAVKKGPVRIYCAAV